MFSHLIFVTGDERELILGELGVEDGYRLCQIDIFLLLFEMSLEFRLRCRSVEIVGSVFCRCVSVFICVDRDDIAGGEDMADGFDDAIDESVIEFQSHIGMDTKCEVEDGTSFGHLDDMSFGCVDENIIVEKLYSKCIGKVLMTIFVIRLFCRIIGSDAIMDFLEPVGLLFGE